MGLNTVKLPHIKNAAELKTIELKLPPRVLISMSQHGGAPCEPTVAVGDFVKTGQLIGDCASMISAPIHSSVTGTVTEIKKILNISGKYSTVVVIKTADRQELSEEITPPIIVSREDFVAAVRRSGSVGLGGAGFPTHVKLNYDRKTTTIDTLIVNGAECEPYITSDYRGFMENSENILGGIRLIMKYMEIPNCIIGIESNKPAAISLMKKLTEKDDCINVKTLKPSYPQGAEKVLIYNTTGRIVGEGMLPMTAGCLVMNSTTVAFIAEYCKTGMPLIKKRLTIDGDIVNKPANVFVPIGTQLSELVAFADVRIQPDRIIFGGPMMGSCIYDPEYPIVKTTNAVLFFGKTKPVKPSNCIRCGKCIRVCSMKLMPTSIGHYYEMRDAEMLKRSHVMNCMNCGACTYVCPAKRNIAETNQLAKLFLREELAKENKK